MHLSRRVAALLGPRSAAPGAPGLAGWAPLLAPFVWALALELVYTGYVKDDAYIAFRYAVNCAHGHGLTFNVGDPPVEGFTSFLWTLSLVPVAWLRLPLLVVCKLGSVAALGGILVVVGRWVERRGGDGASMQMARWLVATNASLIVWAQSGMEPVVTALVVLVAVYRLEQRRHWAAMLLFAVAAGLRPECNLLLLGGALVVLRRRAALPALVALLGVGVMHYWRWRYFGSLLPNTALVKLGRVDWYAGLRSLGELGVTSLAGVTIALALVAAAGARDDVALFCAGALAAFAAYLVRVGRDEMFLVRLYLPVWPLALGLAAPSLAAAWQRRWWRSLPLLVVAAGVAFTAGRLYAIHHIALGQRSHVALAERMKARARPGDLVVFQDLGQTPWAALELRFVDPIGLVDATIARARAREGASPFRGAPSARVQAAIRDHLFGLEPKLIALVAYVPPGMAAETRRQFDAGVDREALFAAFLDANPYHVGLHADARLAHYRLADVVRRKDDYWLILYERRDAP
jgi:hypothetical protein